MAEPIIRVEHLSKIFKITEKGFLKHKVHHIHAVQDVSFKIKEGEVVGIVGESGCGKTTLGRLLIKLLQPTSGRYFLKGEDVTLLSISAFNEHRKFIQMVFQNPYSSLNPSMVIGEQLKEAIALGRSASVATVTQDELLKIVTQVDLTEEILGHYPHQLSGGEARRIGLARILAVNPGVIILDEPVASLDLSIRSNVIHLLMSLKQQLNLTYIWISHDLEVIRHVADRVMVMFGGRLVEIFNAKKQSNHFHPYTNILLKAADKIAGPYSIWIGDNKFNQALFDDSASLENGQGCVYAPFCERYKNLDKPVVCLQEAPELEAIPADDKWVACHFKDN